MSRALDTAIALAFVFAVASLFASVIVEWVSQLLERRAQYLVTALRNMLDEPETAKTTKSTKARDLHKALKEPDKVDELAANTATTPNAEAKPEDTFITAALFAHPMIRGLQTRRVLPFVDGRIRNPQYIPAATFARVLIGTLLPSDTSENDDDAAKDGSNVLVKLRKAVESLPPGFAVRGSLLTLIAQAGNDVRTLQASVEDWYDAQMGRVSGWYKRWVKYVLFAVGLGLALAVNLDSLQIGHTLWTDEPVRTAVVTSVAGSDLCKAQTDPAAKTKCADAALKELKVAGVPIGYPCTLFHSGNAPANDGYAKCVATGFGPSNTLLATLLKLLGLVLTAFAISFGAPFWFDALSKLGSLRSTGPKPSSSAT